MNDPTYVEAARFLAQRMIKEGGMTIESASHMAFDFFSDETRANKNSKSSPPR